MKCVVTGACGFLGIHVVRSLATRGVHIIGMGRSALRAPSEVADFIELDLSQVRLRGQVPGDALIHLAHYQPAPGTRTTPGDVARRLNANLAGVFAVLNHLPALRRVVYASTVFVYPWAEACGVTEEVLPAPFSFYGWEKLLSERLLQRYCASRGLELTICRITQLYGPDEPHQQFVTRMLRAAAAGRPISVQGSGDDARDLLHVEDAADGMVRAVHAAQPGTFNISSGVPTAVADVARLCLKVTGRSEKLLQYCERRDARLRIDYSSRRAAQAFGFAPRIALERGLRDIFIAGAFRE